MDGIRRITNTVRNYTATQLTQLKLSLLPQLQEAWAHAVNLGTGHMPPDDLERGLAPPAPAPAPDPDPGSRGRSSTAYLDGLRGVAALCVYLFHHASCHYGSDAALLRGPTARPLDRWQPLTLPFLGLIFNGGAGCVSVFFVLSGYVLARAPLRLLRHTDGPGPGPGPNPDPGSDRSRQRLVRALAAAAAKRPVRLYLPVVAVSLAVAVALQLPGRVLMTDWPPAQASVGAELRAWAAALAAVLDPLRRNDLSTPWFPYDPPAWTLAAELRGSLLVFSLAGALAAVRPAWRVGALAALAAVLLWGYAWEMACFVAGMTLVLWDLERPVADKGLLLRLRPHAALVAGLYLLGQVPMNPNPDRRVAEAVPGWGVLTRAVPARYHAAEYWRFWGTVGAVLVVGAVGRVRWARDVLGSRPLLRLGRVSFMLYLTHIPFLWTVADRVYRVLGGTVTAPRGGPWWADGLLAVPDRGWQGLSTRFLLAQMIILPANLALAEGATRLLDEPSVRLARWVAAKIYGK